MSDSEVMALAADRPVLRDRRSIDEHLVECERCRARLTQAMSGREHSDRPTLHAAARPGPASTIASSPARESPHSPAGSSGSSSSALSGTAASALQPPVVIPGYDILRKIDSGGQGVVYKATQHGTKRTVAIKVLPQEANASERQKRRFEREVTLAASLQHPNIVTIYHSGVSSGQYFFAMEYIRGQPLDEYLAGANLDLRGKMELFAKICDAVAHAHGRDVTHRDLKPRNILVDGRGEPHILDFGLAKSPAAELLGGEQRVTLSSQFLGTLAYSAPEQGSGDPDLPDRRTDVYALGVVLFEMLTGRLPYKLPGDLEGTLRAIRETMPRKPSDHSQEIGRDLDTIVLRALAKEPGRRYQSAAEMARDVHHWLRDEPIEARRDSAMYLLGSQTRKTLRRQKLPVMAAVAAAAWVFGYFGADLLNQNWPQPAVWYETAAMSLAPPVTDATAFENTRVIAVNDETERLLTELARHAEVTGVDSANWYGSRRLHGWLMKRLAEAGARGVVWDFGYATDTEFDADFAAGVEALLSAEAGAAVAVADWELNERGEPARISRGILDSGALWGGIAMQFPTSETIKVNLVVQHPGRLPTLSLSLAALSIWKHPKTVPMPEIDFARQEVALRFRPRDSKVSQALPRLAEKVTLTGVRQPKPFKDEDAADKLDRESWIGDYVVRLPDDATFERITETYQDVVYMKPEARESWARGRMIIVGDFRSDGEGYFDRHISADQQRQAFGSYLHAAAIDSLMMNARPVIYPSEGWYRGLVAVCAAGGVMLALAAVGSRLRRVALALIAALVVLAATLLACRVSGYLCNPTGLLMALGAGFITWLLCEPLSHSRTEAYTYSSRSATS